MELIKQIERLISEQNFSKAKELAQNAGSELEKLNLLGVILFYETKLDEAIELFKRALEIDPVNPDVLFNYSKALFEKGDYFESWRYLTRIAQKGWEVWDMLGDTQIQLGNPAMALYYYAKAYETSGLTELRAKYEELRKQYYSGQKVAAFCLPDREAFLRDFMNVLSNLFIAKIVASSNGDEIKEAYRWADVVWLEWADELTIEITNFLPKGNKKIICRLHSYEVFTDFPRKIRWENVDVLVLVSSHIGEILKKYHPEVCERIKKIVVIPNGVDLNKFSYSKRSHGFNIAVVGDISYKKDPQAWLQVIGFLRSTVSKEYRLHVAGRANALEEGLRYVNYFEHFLSESGLREGVKFYGYAQDINSFLEDKNFLLSTSIHESFGYNIAEAMAKGIKPIIHNFHGARRLWLDECVYNFFFEIPEILSQPYDSDKYRRHVENNYSLENQVDLIVKLLLETEKDSTKPRKTADGIKDGYLTVRKIQQKIEQETANGIKDDYGRFINKYREKAIENRSNFSSIIYQREGKPTVSVITPAYNAARFLTDLAESLSRQSISAELEWVIVDDCSSDDTLQVAINLAKSSKISVVILKNAKNGGAALSLKKGFEQARGKILAWVSADDFYVDDHKLEKDIQLLESGLDVVFSKHTLIGESLENAKLYSVDDAPWDCLDLFLTTTINNFLNGSSVVMKREAYNSVGGFDEVLWNVDADYDLFSRLFLSGVRVGFSDTKVFKREHQEMTSKKSHLMLLGSSLARSRFLRIPRVRELIFQSVASIKDENIVTYLASRFPFFFHEIANSRERTLGSQRFGTQLSEQLLKMYEDLVEELCKSPVFSKFVTRFST